MPNPEVFIVRVWSQGPGEVFRAAVQRAGTDESTWFTEPGALADYLRRRIDPVTARDSDASEGSSPSHGEST